MYTSLSQVSKRVMTFTLFTTQLLHSHFSSLVLKRMIQYIPVIHVLMQILYSCIHVSQSTLASIQCIQYEFVSVDYLQMPINSRTKQLFSGK